MPKEQRVSFFKGKLGRQFANTINLYGVVDVTVKIDNQNSLSGLTYDVICSRIFDSEKAKIITRDEFIDSWKALILNRIQHVSPRECMKEWKIYDGYVPAPLADLWNSIHMYQDETNGTLYRPVAPTMKKEPKFYDNKFRKFCLVAKEKFIMEYITLSNISRSGGSILITAINDKKDLRSVRSVTKGVTEMDACVRFMNDELFEPLSSMVFDHLNVQCTPYLPLQAARIDYINSFFIQGESLVTRPRGAILATQCCSSSDSSTSDY